MAPPTIEIADSPRASDAYVPRLTREDRDMRIVELVVAGVALLASLFLSIPK